MLLLCLSRVAVEFTEACNVTPPLAERTICMESALCSMGTLTAVRKSSPSYCYEEQVRRVAALTLLCCRLHLEVKVYCGASMTVSRVPLHRAAVAKCGLPPGVDTY